MKRLCLYFFILIQSIACYAQKTIITYDHFGGINVSYNGSIRLSGGDTCLYGTIPIHSQVKVIDDVALFSVLTNNETIESKDFVGITFSYPNNYKNGVCLWRYKPWNSWTKPIQLSKASKMPKNDIQFFYFQYSDGLYCAVMPLSGNGFRTTIGNYYDRWGSKSKNLVKSRIPSKIPSIAIAFDKDPYILFEKIYRVALGYMREDNNLRRKKKFPEVFNYIGWCTWNASENGKNLNEKFLLKAAESFKEKKFPIGWFLIDDGWFQEKDGELQSYEPDSHSFPTGFKSVINKLKAYYRLKYVGIWHAINGLWKGIDPNSFLGNHFKSVLFSWSDTAMNKSGVSSKQRYFIKPNSDSLFSFYNSWYIYFKGQGIDFVKVDNERITEQMALNNFPIFSLSELMHKALNRAVAANFKGALINCMDMTSEAYLNFGSSAVARAVEDYFPYHANENYNLEKGNAAAHVIQAVYNSLYFGQMVFPDFDMFQSHNPNAIYHAIARAINCGPIYISDNIGKQNVDVLWPLIYSDGKTIHSETPLMPTEDCLFQLQKPKLFKAFSMVGNVGLLGAFNAADTAIVEGVIKPSDIKNIQGNDFIIYEYFSQVCKRGNRASPIKVRLPRLGYKLYYIVPVKNNFAALGLIEKYNAPATILEESWSKNKVNIRLYEGGLFKAYCGMKPLKIMINGKLHEFDYNQHQITINIPVKKNPQLTILFQPEKNKTN